MTYKLVFRTSITINLRPTYTVVRLQTTYDNNIIIHSRDNVEEYISRDQRELYGGDSMGESLDRSFKIGVSMKTS